MKLDDFRSIYETFDREECDLILYDLCRGVLEGQRRDPEFYGLVAACVLGPNGERAYANNHALPNGQRVHAERAALDAYTETFGRVPKDAIIITTLSPCSAPMDDRYGLSCTQLIDDYDIRKVYCGWEDPTQDDTELYNQKSFTVVSTDDERLRKICEHFALMFLDPEQLDEDWKKNVAAGALAGLTAFGGISNAWSKAPVNPDQGRPAATQSVKQQTQSPKAPTAQHKKAQANINNNAAGQKLMKAAVAAGMLGDELAQFMAQCATETGGFKQFSEMNQDYSHYEPGTKLGAQLGNTQPGDGAKYHGRGYIQLTGRANYAETGKGIGVDLVNHPELMNNLDVAARAAIFYWQHHVAPHVNDFSDTRACTKHINAGLRMLDQRQANFDAFQQNKLSENFADGKGPGRPGDSQRHGIPKGATIAQLEKAAKASGRKGQLARWQLNMRRGKAKAK